jgi:hypothetical protein
MLHDNNMLQMTAVEDFAQKRKNAPKRAFSFLLGEPSSDSSPSALWKKREQTRIVNISIFEQFSPRFCRFLTFAKIQGCIGKFSQLFFAKFSIFFAELTCNKFFQN